MYILKVKHNHENFTEIRNFDKSLYLSSAEGVGARRLWMCVNGIRLCRVLAYYRNLLLQVVSVENELNDSTVDVVH